MLSYYCSSGAKALAVAAMASAFPFSVDAATDTDTFSVTATVISACSISASDHDFGDYDAISGDPLDSTSSISVTCTSGASYSIDLNGGTTLGGAIAARLMSDNSNTLNYNLYTDGTYATVWGDGTGGSEAVSGTGSGSLQTLTVYGRIPSGQGEPTGSYSDVVTATITY